MNVPAVQSLTRRQQAFLWLASIGPLGHLPASGTVTVAVVGLPLFWLLHGCSWVTYVLITSAIVAAAVYVHDVGDRLLQEHDSRRLVWDELAGFLVAVAFVPFTWQSAVFALLLERGLDIIKLPPARWVERRWPGGWGDVGDDVIAGLCTCMILHGMVRLAPHWLGLPVSLSI